MRRGPQQQAPEWKIEPAEMLRMPLVLKVMKHRDRRASRKDRRCEPWVEQDIQAIARCLQRQRRLFPQNPRRAKTRVHGLRLPMEIRPLRHEVGAGFEIGENELFVLRFRSSNRPQQLPTQTLLASD